MDASRAQAEATRLLPLAQRALKRYPFLTREVRHLATHSNVLFRVVTESGQQMVLRVGTPHANSRTNIQLEVSWLDALNHETSLEVVRPIRTAGGGLIADEYDEEIDATRSCVLFSWIPGQPMAQGSGPFAYRLLGAMAASLADHGRTWDPPPGVEMRRWDQVFYYEEDFDPVIIHDPLYGHLFGPRRATAIRKAIELSESVISDSYADAEPQVVHGDLHEWNVHLAGSRLYAFDFEDVMLALPAQDAAICLYSSRNDDAADEIQAAFRRGYEAIAEWPIVDKRQLDGFHAARQIMLMNYAARTLRMEEAADFIDRVMPWLERYVDRYG
ncbi:MAG: phosphotransferase [Acidimicrobiia bacterium]|jgi:Ser/Thr protein kinase RdoA (MazF antagonist)